MKPTEQQRLIIDYGGNAVVIASPGSGKTYVLSEKIKDNLKNIEEYQGVIAISYTNKASIELKNRSLSNGENPKSSFFGTIDTFNLSEIIIPFAKQLFGLPSDIIQVSKISSLPNEDKDNFIWLNNNISWDEITDDQISILKMYFLEGTIFIETIGLFANYVLFNSIACQNYIKARYKYIYIDEYQDSGFEQNQIFLKINSLGIIAVAVGDLNQSIFAFSGKDSKYLEELTRNNAFKYYKLDKNHRSHPSIINYSNYLLNPKTELIPTEQNLIYFTRVEGTEKEIALFLDEKIESIRKFFSVKKLNQIAILTKSIRTGEIINLQLKTPHKLSLTNDLDINLNVWSAIFSNLLYFTFDKNFNFIDVIEVFTTYDKFNSPTLKKLNEAKESIDRLVFSENLDIEQLKQEFIKIARIIAPNSENIESIELLTEVLNNPTLLKSYEPSKENEVNILTIHKSKGLEYDFVVHLDLYEWILPNKQPGLNNDFNNPIYKDLKQDINLHYVGITRARKGCLLVSSTKRTNYQGEIKNGKDSEFLWDNNIQELRFKKNV